MNGGGRITVVSWSEEDLLEGGEELNWWGGFFERGMRWKDYLDNFEKELHPYLEAARRSAVENQIRAKGPEHQYEGGDTGLFRWRLFRTHLPSLGRLYGCGVGGGRQYRPPLYGFLHVGA